MIPCLKLIKRLTKERDEALAALRKATEFQDQEGFIGQRAWDDWARRILAEGKKP